MPQIVKNSQTGAYGVVDDSGAFIKGATVAMHSDSGQIMAFGVDGSPLAIYNPKTNLQIPIGQTTDNKPQVFASGRPIPPPQPNAPSAEIDTSKFAPPEDPKSGFINSFYEAGIKPLQDQAQEFLDRGDLGVHQLRVLATGLVSQTNDFVDKLLRHSNNPNAVGTALPLIGPVIQKMQDQMKEGDYRGAIGTLAGAAAPFATDSIGEGATAVKSAIKNAPETVATKVLPRMFPTNTADILPEDTAAASTDASARSTGQLTGNATASLLEQTHGGKVASDLVNEERATITSKLADLKKQFVPNGIPQNVNGILQKKLAENYFDAENAKNQQYSNFQTNHVEKNTMPVLTEVPNPAANLPQSKRFDANGNQLAPLPATIQQVQHIQGPVFLHETLPLATELKTKLDAFKNGPEFQKLPEISKNNFNKISSTVNNLIQPTKSIFQDREVNLPVAAYDKVKQLRTDIGRSLSGLSEFGLPDKMLSDIKTSLGNDLQNSVKNYWGNGQTPLQGSEFLNNPADLKKYIGKHVTYEEGNIRHSFGAINDSTPPKIQSNVNGSDLDLYKQGKNFFLGKIENGELNVYGTAKDNYKGQLEHLVIAPKYQNKGLAQSLLQARSDAGLSNVPSDSNYISQEGANAINTFNRANPSSALQDLQNANASHVAFKRLFDKNLKGKIFSGNSNLSKTGGNMTDPTTLVDDVGKSPVIAKQFMDGLGPQNSNLAKGAVLDKLMKESTNTADASFSPDKLINALESPGYRELFSATDRSNIVNVMRQLRTMNPADLSSKVGITKNMMFHMALPGAGLAVGAATGHMGVGALAGGMLEIGLSQFARRILLDPKYARIAAQLPYAPAGSEKAGLLQSQVLKGLAGTSVGVVLKNGSKVPAQVDGEGKITLQQ